MLLLIKNEMPFHLIPIKIIANEILEIGILNKNEILEYCYHTVSNPLHRKLLDVVIPKHIRKYETIKPVMHSQNNFTTNVGIINKITEIKNNDKFHCELLNDDNTQTGGATKVKMTLKENGIHLSAMPFCLDKETIAKWEIYFDRHKDDFSPSFGIGNIKHKNKQLVGTDSDVKGWGIQISNREFRAYVSGELKQVVHIGVKTKDKLMFEFNGLKKELKIFKNINNANNLIYAFKNMNLENQSFYPLCANYVKEVIFTFQNFVKIQ